VPSHPPPPQATLLPETEEARGALGDKTAVRMTSFPFKVGRESRDGRFQKLKAEFDRRMGGHPPLNDLYLIEPPGPLQISREHFAIDWIDGQFFLLDRGSTCGAGVAGRRVGAETGTASIDLHDGDPIVVGAERSPYVFRFRVSTIRSTP
jgi:hypothetical protein